MSAHSFGTTVLYIHFKNTVHTTDRTPSSTENGRQKPNRRRPRPPAELKNKNTHQTGLTLSTFRYIDIQSTSPHAVAAINAMSSTAENEDRRCNMSMKMSGIGPMADRHLVAAQLLKEQTCQKFTTKSSKDLSTENRTDKLMNFLSAQTMATSFRSAVSEPSQSSRSFRNLNATRTAAASQSAPAEVDRKDKLMKMYSLAPTCQKSINTINNSQQNTSISEKKRGFWSRRGGEN